MGSPQVKCVLLRVPSSDGKIGFLRLAEFDLPNLGPNTLPSIAAMTATTLFGSAMLYLGSSDAPKLDGISKAATGQALVALVQDCLLNGGSGKGVLQSVFDTAKGGSGNASKTFKGLELEGLVERRRDGTSAFIRCFATPKLVKIVSGIDLPVNRSLPELQYSDVTYAPKLPHSIAAPQIPDLRELMCPQAEVRMPQKVQVITFESLFGGAMRYLSSPQGPSSNGLNMATEGRILVALAQDIIMNGGRGHGIRQKDVHESALGNGNTSKTLNALEAERVLYRESDGRGKRCFPTAKLLRLLGIRMPDEVTILNPQPLPKPSPAS